MTTTVVYPDAFPESTTVDGYVYETTNATFATMRAAAGDGAYYDTGIDYFTLIEASATTNQYDLFIRSIFLFDTSAIPSGDVLTSATLALYVNAKYNDFATNPTLDIVSSAPASNTELEAGDFDSLGTTVFGDIAWASISNAVVNSITLSTTAITKAGITKLGSRLSWDTDNSAPTWGDSYGCTVEGYFADAIGTTNDPKLTVVHEAPTGAMLTQSRLLQTAITGGRLVR